MSALLAHAKATRILGQALMEEVDNPYASAETRALLRGLGTAHIRAASLMEDAARAEATGNGEASE